MAAGYVDEHKLVLYRDGAQPRDITAFANDMTLTDDLIPIYHMRRCAAWRQAM